MGLFSARIRASSPIYFLLFFFFIVLRLEKLANRSHFDDEIGQRSDDGAGKMAEVDPG